MNQRPTPALFKKLKNTNYSPPPFMTTVPEKVHMYRNVCVVSFCLYFWHCIFLLQLQVLY